MRELNDAVPSLMGLVLRPRSVRLVPESLLFRDLKGSQVFNREYLTGVLNKVKVSGKGKREEPSIRIRDESLTSLGFKTLSV